MNFGFVKFLILVKAFFSDFLFFLDCPNTCTNSNSSILKLTKFKKIFRRNLFFFLIFAKAVTQNPNITLVTNGCGSYGFTYEFESELIEFNTCCHSHDICYQICGNLKQYCDDTFRTCLKNVCEKYIRVDPDGFKARSNICAFLINLLRFSFKYSYIIYIDLKLNLSQNNL